MQSGGNGISDKTVTAYYNTGSEFMEITSTATSSDGTGHYSITWNVPSSLTNSFYVIKAAFAGDGPYLPCEETTSDTIGGGGLFITPEYNFGALTGALACFVAFALFIRTRRRGK